MITPLVMKRHQKYIIDNPWLFNGQPFTYEHIEDDYFGFVYLLIDEDGKRYIGRKTFFSVRSKAVPGKKRKVKERLMSDWMSYYSSNDVLKAQSKAGKKITRIILSIHKSQADLNFSETSAIFTSGALHLLAPDGTPLYYNNQVDNKYYQRNYLGIADRSVYATTPAT